MKSKISCFLIIAFFSLAAGLAQEPAAPSPSSSYEEKLKPVFQEWERPDRPGGVVAVVEKGQVVYKKCFGQANVEYEFLNTPRTAFDVGPLAEGITGMAIAMLEDQGRLSAADPVKKYVPELPAWADALTIAHLLYHTSGLIDWFELMAGAGWNDGDVITLDQVLKILRRQNRLLFEPGLKYFYSRTDYVLLSELVRRATGQSFRDWTWENIFKPLGMTKTLFRDNFREVIENRAYSINYHPRDGYLKGADNLSAVGAMSLFTTLDDFIKWVVNLETPQVGSARVKEKMLTPGRLSDGQEAGHSYGFVVDSYKGLKQVQKSGSWGGFRTTFRYYPAASFGVFVFANWDYSWNEPNMYADNVVDVCLESLIEKPKTAQPPAEKKKPVTLSPAALAQYEGEYRAGGRTYLIISQEKGGLLFKAGSQAFRLIPAGEGRFSFEDPNIPIVLTFSRGPDGKVSQLSYNAGSAEVIAPKVERENLSPDQLKRYEGTYSSEELNTRYEVVRRDGRLVLTSLRMKDVVLSPENRRIFVGEPPAFQLVSFLVDESGEVSGFQVESDNLRHLVFKKI